MLVTLGAACPHALRTRAPPVDPRAPELAAAPPSRVALEIDLDFTEMFAGVEELVPGGSGRGT